MANPDDVVYQIVVANILEVAQKVGIPPDQLSDAVIAYIQGKIEQAFQHWAGVVEDALDESRIKFSLN